MIESRTAGDCTWLAQNEMHQKQDGWIAADLHVHSTCSPDVLCFPAFHPEAIYQKAKAMGMGYITITDHDTMDAYDIIGWQRENLVTGVEISILDPLHVGHTIHVNIYDLNRGQFREITQISKTAKNIYTLLEYLKDQRLPFVYNHPFWFAAYEKPNYRIIDHLISLFPVVEYNMKRVMLKNALAAGLAARHGKGIIAATDTHIGQVGSAYTLSKGDTFRTYYENIIQGNSRIVPQDLNYTNLNQEILSWIRLLFSIPEVKGIKTHYTGITAVDNGINFFANTQVNNSAILFPVLNSLLVFLTKSGLFSSLYLTAQKITARRIQWLLQSQLNKTRKTIQKGFSYEPLFTDVD